MKRHDFARSPLRVAWPDRLQDDFADVVAFYVFACVRRCASGWLGVCARGCLWEFVWVC